MAKKCRCNRCERGGEVVIQGGEGFVRADEADWEDAIGGNITGEDQEDFQRWIEGLGDRRIPVGYYRKDVLTPGRWMAEGRNPSINSLIYVFQ